jgi:hypothetical protein
MGVLGLLHKRIQCFIEFGSEAKLKGESLRKAGF